MFRKLPAGALAGDLHLLSQNHVDSTHAGAPAHVIVSDAGNPVGVKSVAPDGGGGGGIGHVGAVGGDHGMMIDAMAAGIGNAVLAADMVEGDAYAAAAAVDAAHVGKVQWTSGEDRYGRRVQILNFSWGNSFPFLCHLL